MTNKNNDHTVLASTLASVAAQGIAVRRVIGDPATGRYAPWSAPNLPRGATPARDPTCSRPLPGTGTHCTAATRASPSSSRPPATRPASPRTPTAPSRPRRSPPETSGRIGDICTALPSISQGSSRWMMPGPPRRWPRAHPATPGSRGRPVRRPHACLPGGSRQRAAPQLFAGMRATRPSRTSAVSAGLAQTAVAAGPARRPNRGHVHPAAAAIRRLPPVGDG
jgi:hypothetical protein